MKHKMILLSSLLCLFLLCTCASAEKLSIVAVDFPSYDLAKALAGGEADIHMLLPPGSESHSYEPTAKDMIRIQKADLFMFTGGESDHWIEEMLSSMEEHGPLCFRLMDHVQNLCEEHSHSMEHEHTDEGIDHEEEEMDEHVWTSPKNMILLSQALAEELVKLMPNAEEMIFQRASDYVSELEKLDLAFTNIVANGKRNTIVFGDRFPFRYFASAYGLNYDAAFPGCSEDSEPSVRTVISLIKTIQEQSIPVVFYIEFSSRRTADILAEETGAVPMLFHSCHNVSQEEIDSGATYLSLMWNNCNALKEALN